MDIEWKQRSDLNWCFSCWFGAKIESKETSIGTLYLCHCGVTVRQYNGEDPADNKELPRYFATDEEWDVFWQNNFQIKE